MNSSGSAQPFYNLSRIQKNSYYFWRNKMKYLLKSKWKWALTLGLLLIMALGAVGTVRAAEFFEGDAIPAGETIDDDVFVSGGNVVVDGTVNGNLFASGGTVTLNGWVSGDAFLVAERVVVSESAVVDGNLFFAGADLIINGQVGGSVFGGSTAMLLGESANTESNLYYGGFSLEAESGSRVGMDLYAGVFQVILSGTIERDLNVGAAAVELNGLVGRDAHIDVGQVEMAKGSGLWMQFNPYVRRYVKRTISPGIRFLENAQINGKLTYTSSIQQIDRLDEVVADGVVYQTPVPQETVTPREEGKPFKRGVPGEFIGGVTFLSIARTFIRLMVLGALAVWLLPAPLKKLTDAVTAEPLKAMGWGFVVLAIGFFAVLIVPLVFILIGVILGFLSLGSLLYVWFGILGVALLLIFMLFFFAVFTLSKVLAAFLFGRWLMKALFKMEKENVWISLLLGVFLYVIIRSLPVAGWLAGLAATLIGTGSFWLAYFHKKTA